MGVVLNFVAATTAESERPLPGDDLVPDPDITMDRAFDLAGSPEQVWPWLVQLGKQRAGWYLPRSIERFLPKSRRATRKIEARWQGLKAGDVIPDYGGKHETFETVDVRHNQWIVYKSVRGATRMSWSLSIESRPDGSSRVQARLRLAPVKHRRIVASAGEFFDLLTIAGMAAGLRERVSSPQ